MRTVVLLVVAALLQLAVSFFAARPDLLPDGGFYLVRALAIIGTALLVVRVVSQGLIEIVLPRLLGRPPDDIFKVIIVGLCYGIAGAMVLRLAFNQDMATILTASALFTAIIGLALQATLNNLFSGTALQLERSFRIGDLVRIGTVQGHIEALTWRAMHLRTIDNSLLIIPNSQLNTTLVELFRSGASCRHTMRVPAALVVPPETIIEIIGGVLASLAESGRLERPEVMLDALAGNEGAAWYKIFFHTERFLDGVPVEAEIRTRYWYALARRGLAVAVNSVYSAAPTLPDDRDELAGRLAALPEYRKLAAGDRAELAGRLRRLPFAAGEPIRIGDAARDARFVVHRGAVAMPGLAEDGAVASGKLRHWSETEIARVTEALAAIMGPIAETLVRRAADATRDPYTLYRRLAAFIEDETARARFLSGSPAAPARIVEPHALVGAEELRGCAAVAIGHTELIELASAAPAPASAAP